jgi:hypothetical protein
MLKVRVMVVYSPLASFAKRGEIEVRLNACSAAADGAAYRYNAEPVESSSRAACAASRQRDAHGPVPRRQVFAIHAIPLITDPGPAIHIIAHSKLKMVAVSG